MIQSRNILLSLHSMFLNDQDNDKKKGRSQGNTVVSLQNINTKYLYKKYKYLYILYYINTKYKYASYTWSFNSNEGALAIKLAYY